MAAVGQGWRPHKLVFSFTLIPSTHQKNKITSSKKRKTFHDLFKHFTLRNDCGEEAHAAVARRSRHLPERPLRSRVGLSKKNYSRNEDDKKTSTRIYGGDRLQRKNAAGKGKTIDPSPQQSCIIGAGMRHFLERRRCGQTLTRVVESRRTRPAPRAARRAPVPASFDYDKRLMKLKRSCTTSCH
ncbi:hypothetical protein EVAR_20819_1 [Eumeta japonica]|uniref:Uncharacterized protein n=1 Tax=Eumeta variegata TaxID=151549 RepID=A0A4C1UDH8_EUMVA|nr:hypothetical protein EVAR_20819_1 [Eumeta japonica]